MINCISTNTPVFMASMPRQLSEHKSSLFVRIAYIVATIFTLGFFCLLQRGLQRFARKAILLSSTASENYRNFLDKLKLEFLAAHPNRAAAIKVQTYDKALLDGMEIYRTSKASLLSPEKQKWIVYFNGIAEHYESNLDALLPYADATQKNILAFNYRGTGRSSSEAKKAVDLAVDGDACIQHLLALGVKPANIMVHGYSLGGGAGGIVSGWHQGCRYLSEKSFATLGDVIRSYQSKNLKGRLKGLGEQFLASSAGWAYDSIKSWKKSTGSKGVLLHKQDNEIYYKQTDLYTALKKRNMRPHIIAKQTYEPSVQTVHNWEREITTHSQSIWCQQEDFQKLIDVVARIFEEK